MSRCYDEFSSRYCSACFHYYFHLVNTNFLIEIDEDDEDRKKIVWDSIFFFVYGKHCNGDCMYNELLKEIKFVNKITINKIVILIIL